MAIEIPSNEFWGRRYGTNDNAKWGKHFPKVGYGSPSSNAGKGINTESTAQAKADKKNFVATGRPVHKYDWKNKRIH